MIKDIVYILGKGSKWGNREIRYSLRSLSKLNSYGKVFIVGACPSWINEKKIIHIPAEDRHANKLKNAIEKILFACRDSRVSDDFILMNDDFLFLRKTDEINTYDKGSLESAERDHKTQSGYYFSAIRTTRRILSDIGVKGEVDFEVHYPMVLNKAKFIKTISKIDYLTIPFLFRSVYGNMNKVESKYIDDPKLYSLADFKKFKDGNFISTDNNVVLEKEFQKWIKRKFPGQSPYERERKDVLFATKTFQYGGRVYNPGDIVEYGLPDKIVAEQNLQRRSRVL